MNDRPILRVHVGGNEQPLLRPLSDDELDAIPRTSRSDQRGLSDAAKAVYRARRAFARGGVQSFVTPRKLEEKTGYSPDTRKRADDELVAKGYLQRTETHRRRVRVMLLLRGAPSGDSDSPAGAAVAETAKPANPATCGVANPQPAAATEQTEGTTRALSPRVVPSDEAAASPAPPEGGSAAAKKRKTGYRFQRSANGTAGTFVRDPDGTDRPPSGYFTPPEEPQPRPLLVALRPVDPPELRRQRAAELREWIAESFGTGLPAGERLGEGVCPDCPADAPPAALRIRVGKLELCPHHAELRNAVALRLAADLVRVGAKSPSRGRSR